MKQQILSIVIVILCTPIFSQQIPLSEFSLSNSTAPAFVLLEETPTEVYVPENLKSLTVHTLNNFNESLSIELNPYYFIDTKNKKRTFYKYMGIEEENGKYRQNPFSGITRATSLSFSYLSKEFMNIANGNKNVYSLGFRTKLFRLYNPKTVKITYDSISKVLNEVAPIPQKILIKLVEKDDDEQQNIIDGYYRSQEGKDYLNSEEVKEFYSYDEAIKKLQSGGVYKTIKPMFQIDGALAYGILFEQNNINSATLNRFGTWLTSELSLPINAKKQDSKMNNYINAFVVLRYVQDGFNFENNTMFYRDFGGKLELEIGRFSFGYEYIQRNGSVESERSVGNIKFLLSKDVSLSGGFGKDFSSEENLVTLFGVNWGLNFGSN